MPPLEWNGDELVRRLRRAVADAANDTVDATAADARTSHPWRNRSHNLEAHIDVEHADPRGRHIVARVGYAYAGGRKHVRDGFYGLFHEEGTTHEFARPTLRPAADRQFPTFAARVAKHFRSSRA